MKETKKLEATFGANKPMKKISKRGANVFYWVMFALPLAQFLICYVAVNFNSILLAFQTTEKVVIDGVQTYVTDWADPIFGTFEYFFTVEMQKAAWKVGIPNSLKYFVFSVIITIPLGLIFSFYIFKKYPLGEVFRVFLFLPSVICSLVLAIFYEYIVDVSIPQLVQMITGTTRKTEGMLSRGETAFNALIFFNFWFTFGPSTLVYLNAMSQVDTAIIEAAELDGATGIKQFWYVVLPLIYSSITSYLIICVAQVAINQMSVHAFYGSDVATQMGVTSIGYNLFVKIAEGDAQLNYPIAAAGGIFFTLIVAPVTLVLRWALEKFGPSEE